MIHPLAARALQFAPEKARALAAESFARGLAVTGVDGKRAIPLGIVPVVLERGEIERRRALAGVLSVAVRSAAHWRLANDRSALDAALSPAEARLVAATARAPATLAVARVDFLIAGSAHALEVNATIPAMQAYSDIAAATWIEHAAADGEAARLVAANGSNSTALHDALQALHREAGRGDANAIGLLCRRGDAQLTELAHLAAHWRSLGCDARIVHPDELATHDGWLTADRAKLQLVYRHLFLSRLDAQPSAQLEHALVQARDSRTLVLNSPAAHLESKATLALLSRTQLEPGLADAIGLDHAARDTIATSLPWTRELRAGPARLEDGSETRDLVAHVAAHPDDYVLKRAWSYGGHDVHVGRTVRAADGTAAWERLCGRAAADARGGGFVVQRAVRVQPARQLLATPDRVHDALAITDYSAFATPGVDVAWGGVCRAAASEVVNIVGGGGVVPLLERSVADALEAMLAARDAARARERGA